MLLFIFAVKVYDTFISNKLMQTNKTNNKSAKVCMSMQNIPESDSNWSGIHQGQLGVAPTCEPDLQIPQSRESLSETAEGSDGHQPD